MTFTTQPSFGQYTPDHSQLFGKLTSFQDISESRMTRNNSAGKNLVELSLLWLPARDQLAHKCADHVGDAVLYLVEVGGVVHEGRGAHQPVQGVHAHLTHRLKTRIFSTVKDFSYMTYEYGKPLTQSISKTTKRELLLVLYTEYLFYKFCLKTASFVPVLGIRIRVHFLEVWIRIRIFHFSHKGVKRTKIMIAK
jgi:hypothetical protein